MEGPRQHVQILSGPHFSVRGKCAQSRWNWHLSSIVLMLKVYPTFRNEAVFDRQGLRESLFCNQYFKDWLEAG